VSLRQLGVGSFLLFGCYRVDCLRVFVVPREGAQHPEHATRRGEDGVHSCR